MNFLQLEQNAAELKDGKDNENLSTDAAGEEVVPSGQDKYSNLLFMHTSNFQGRANKVYFTSNFSEIIGLLSRFNEVAYIF